MQTPYYVIHEKKMDDNYQSFERCLKRYWKKHTIGYSVKTNNFPWLLRHMKELGAYAEVVSEDEFRLARETGFPVNEIIYNGPVKSEKSFLEAVRGGAIVNLDSKRELEWLKTLPGDPVYRIGIRVNVDMEKQCPGETQSGVSDSRFGFCYENGELGGALDSLKKNNVRLRGLHLHVSSKTRSLSFYEALARYVVEIVRRYRLRLDFVDIGGGFFGGLPDKPSFEQYFRAISAVFYKEPLLQDIHLIAEPGMAVVGAFIDYLSSVIDIKDTLHNRFVVVDGSRTNLDPLMRKRRYCFQLIQARGEMPILGKQTVCGFTCMENDRFFELSNVGELVPGDKILFKKVGAYTMGLTPLFIQFFPEVYVERDGKYECVGKKWLPQDFTAGYEIEDTV